MRKSLHKAQGIPCQQVRWTLPTQLIADIGLVSRYLQLHDGEVATVLVRWALQKLVDRYNETAAIRIPELPSLVDEDYQGYTMRAILSAMEGVSRRRT